MTKVLLDVAGRRRSPATLPGFGAGRSPRNKGLSYPADPPNVEEIVAVMRAADDGPHGRRLRALIVVLWRAGLRIREALALSESDLVTVVARFWSVAARAADAVRSAWTSGPGSSWSPGTPSASNSPSARCSASSTAQPAGGLGRPQPSASSCDARQPPPASGGASPCISSATPTRSRWPTKGSAGRHSAPARPQQSRHHVGLPASHRQRRDHRHRPRPPRAHDLCQRVAAALTAPARAHRAKRQR
jgi:hypothetical protein